MAGDLWVLKGSGQVLENVHQPGQCAGYWCTIHRPMPGPWRDWPMRFIANVVMVRTCPHGIAHPAVEDVINLLAYSDHDCDGCDCGADVWVRGQGGLFGEGGTGLEPAGWDVDPDLDARPGPGDETGPLA